MEINENFEQENVKTADVTETTENIETTDAIETTEKEETTKTSKPKTYDIAGLLIGAGVGIFLAIIGITDILMGIIVGMFFGLVIGTFIKKK